jgi:multicomponent Na+:H+ antiporter subunit G
MIEGLVSFLVLLGCFFALLSGIGIIRLPDCYCRLHAATKAGAFGGSILALAVGLSLGGAWTWTEAVILVGFFYTTMPVSAHLLARTARRAGIEPAGETKVGELERFERGGGGGGSPGNGGDKLNPGSGRSGPTGGKG